MLIRSLHLRDIDRVAAIESETLSPWSISSLKNELLVQNGLQGVAESKKSGIVGWCACRKIPPESELLKITVQEKHRKKGVASALLAWLTNEISACGVKTIFLEVRSQNYTALKFYQKNGFLQIGERIDYYANPPDNALNFQKNLKI